MTDDSTAESPQDRPPYEAWFVIEVDVAPDRETPLYASLSGPFRAEEQAEHERDEQQAAWDRALEEWDGENPYEFKGWDITKQYLSEFQISQLDRQDEEPHRITRDAVNAVGASLLADEGIGPLAGEHND